MDNFAGDKPASLAREVDARIGDVIDSTDALHWDRFNACFSPGFRPEAWRKARIESIPVKRIGTVDDIANACVYLAGETGGFITGEVIHVNGGQFRF